MKIFAVLLSLVLVAGCATRGGWPCWSWEKNTDQKNDAAAAKMLNAETNNPSK